MDPATIAMLVQAAASVASGAMGAAGQGGGETKMQRQKRKLIDQLLAGLNGQGAYAGLFDTDENAFNKSFVEPAKAMFNNQIAPQIQQNAIAGGQQRSSGLNSDLTRAGVDLDAMLNQYMYQSQQDALNRKQNIIGQILGGGDGAANQPTTAQNFMSAASGFLSGKPFGDWAANKFNPQGQGPRKGFEAVSASYGTSGGGM